MIFTDKAHEDFRVLLVGAICTLLIFSIVTAFEGVVAAPMFQVDLVLQK